MNTIYGSFNDPASAEKAVGALLDHGVRKEDVSVISSHDGRTQVSNPDLSASEGMAYEPMFGYNPALGAVAIPPVYPGVPVPTAGYNEGEINTTRAETSPYLNDNTYNPSGETYQDRDVITDTSGDTENSAKEGISTTTAADAGEGAIKGTAWGAGLGILAGLAALFVPGVGLVWGGGALAIALGAAAATTAAGAVAGAVTGYLVDQGVDAEVAQQYEQTLNSGGALVAVAVPSGSVGEVEARQILNKYAAQNINASTPRGYVA